VFVVVECAVLDGAVGIHDQTAGKHGVEGFAKRRLRRVERRKVLGWWFRKTGL
jgi:hypothetical protein